MVVATEVIFSQDKAARAPCSYSTPASANAGLRENGPRPFGLRRKAGHAALLVAHLEQPNLAPRLAGFAAATRRSYRCEQALDAQRWKLERLYKVPVDLTDHLPHQTGTWIMP